MYLFLDPFQQLQVTIKNISQNMTVFHAEKLSKNVNVPS